MFTFFQQQFQITYYSIMEFIIGQVDYLHNFWAGATVNLRVITKQCPMANLRK